MLEAACLMLSATSWLVPFPLSLGNYHWQRLAALCDWPRKLHISGYDPFEILIGCNDHPAMSRTLLQLLLIFKLSLKFRIARGLRLATG